jgi:ATP-dependent exoDNAse (exonuclease V) beta subunit
MPMRTMTMEGLTGSERLTGWDLVDPESLPKGGGNVSPGPSPAAGLGSGIRTLTPEQELAIERRGEPLLLAAGAGSGKTSVLVERFVRAVREDGIPPERILAITFTERAAAELRERVHARLLALGESQAAHAMQNAYVGTFHGFCARILRAHAREAGLTQAPHEILDEALAGRLRRQAFADALGEFLQGERNDAVDLIAAYGADRTRATVIGVYAELRSHGQRAPRLPAPSVAGYVPLTLEEAGARENERQAQGALDEQGARAVALWDELLQRFSERYEVAKHARDGLDFDDLELRAGELLAQDAHVRQEWAERFELLMVDELQDVNPRQLALVQALERENLFTVGDEWQSIYGFRHADVSLFRAREVHLAPRGQSLRLLHNFRGRSELLQAVNAVFVTRFGGAFTPLRPGRERDRAREAHGDPCIELLLSDRRGWNSEQAPGATGGSGPGSGAAAVPWREAEARALAERVGELVRDGKASPGGVAVLLRAMGDVECYEDALREQNLKTVSSAGAFWERQEVVDLLAYLRALADPLDEVGLYGALAAPPVELSSDGMALLSRVARERGDSVWALARERPETAEYCAWLARERELAGVLTLGQLLERAIEHGDGDERARPHAHEDGQRRFANMSKLIELAQEWERSEGHDLRGFLEEAAFQQGAGGGVGYLAGAETVAQPDAIVEEENRDAVRLMSVHAAKGLEFDVVCIADLGRAPSMSVPHLLVSGERIGVRVVDLEDPEPRPALQFARLAQERSEAQAQEEDRIVYVAMTRARERLLLSGAVDFASWPRERPGAPPIAWLGPALVPELPALCAQARQHPRAGTDSVLCGAPTLTDAGRLTMTLTVDGTDVPLRLWLNVPGLPA